MSLLYRVKQVRKSKTSIIYKCIYMESRKMVLMNLSVGQQWRHRLEDRLMDTVGEGEGRTN